MRGGRIGKARLVYFGCVDRAKVAHAVSAAVAGRCAMPLPDSTRLRARPSARISTPDDTPGLRGDTRLHMATVLTRRVLNGLSERAAA